MKQIQPYVLELTVHMSNLFVNAHINLMHQFTEYLKIKKSVHETFIPSKLSCLQWQNRANLSHNPLHGNMVLEDRRSGILAFD